MSGMFVVTTLTMISLMLMGVVVFYVMICMFHNSIFSGLCACCRVRDVHGFLPLFPNPCYIRGKSRVCHTFFRLRISWGIDTWNWQFVRYLCFLFCFRKIGFRKKRRTLLL